MRAGDAGVSGFGDGGPNGFGLLGIDPGILSDERCLRRKGEDRAGFFEYLHHLKEKKLLRCKVVRVLAFENVAKEFDFKSIFGEPEETDARRLIFYFRIVVEKVTDFPEDVTDVIRGEIIAKADRLLAEKLVAEAEILYGRAGHDAVGDGEQGALGSPQARGAEANVLDHASLIVDLAGVADHDDLVEQNGDAAEHVLERFLGAEAERERADADAGEGSGNVNAQTMQ